MRERGNEREREGETDRGVREKEGGNERERGGERGVVVQERMYKSREKQTGKKHIHDTRKSKMHFLPES